MFYSLTFDDVVTLAVDNSYKTLAAIIVADTVGHRCRIRSLIVNPADDVPPDMNVGIRIGRIADVSGGTAGTSTAVTAGNIPKRDPRSVDCLMSGARNYTAEPTSYETEPVFQAGFNVRGGLVKHWHDDDDEAIAAIADQLLGLLAAPRGTTAVRLSGSIGFEVY